MKVLDFAEEKCSGCRCCELACSFKRGGVFSPSRSCIRNIIFDREAFYYSVYCTQCAEAACIAICPSAALEREEGAMLVQHDPERCTGCKICLLACPLGAMKALGDEVFKCDLCGGEPECVLFCPTGALSYVELDLVAYEKRTHFARRMRELSKKPG